MKFKIIQSLFVLVLITYVFTIFPNRVSALTNNILASDFLGQYDGTSYTDPVPMLKYESYTIADMDSNIGRNDGPNNFGFNTPTDIALDSINHRLFISDRINNRVLVYNLNNDNTLSDRIPDNVLGSNSFFLNFASDIPNQSGMWNPYGLAYDGFNNRLFVADYRNNRVLVYDVTTINDGEPAINVLGQTDFVTATAGTTQSKMSAPVALAYDSTNSRIFVSDVTNNRVTVYNVDPSVLIPNDPSTDGPNAINVLGQTTFTIGTTGNTIAKVNAPKGLAYDDINKRLFVAQSGNHRVTVYNVDPTVLIPNTPATDGPNAINVLGQTLFTGATGATTQPKMNAPYGLVYEPVTKKLFVSQTTANRITTYNVDPTVLIPNTPASDGSNAIEVLGQPDFTTGTAGTTQAKVSSPVGMTYDSTNNRLFVVQTGNHRVLTFDVSSISNGEDAVDLLGQYDGTSYTDPVPIYTKGGMNDGPNKFGFNNPVSMVFDAKNHRFFVADSGNNRILIYNLNTDNTFPDYVPDNVLGQTTFYSNNVATTQSGMNAPDCITYDSDNNRLFVVDSNNHRVLVYDVTIITDGEPAINVLGQTTFTTATATTTQNGMNNPRGLAYDSVNKRLFVSQSTNGNRVTVYNVDPTVLIPNTPATDGPNAINVIGQTDFITGTGVTSQAKMIFPNEILYESNTNKLFVLQRSSGSNRVTVYNVDPTVLVPNTPATDGPNAINILGQPDFITSTTGTTQSKFNDPNGVAYDSINNYLFVAEQINNRVTIFNLADGITDGEPAINILGQPDFTTGTKNRFGKRGMYYPSGLEYDSTNNRLFEVDYATNRILFFDLSDTTITSVGASSGTYTTGETIQISVTFSKVVNVTDTPTLTLETGEIDRTASYSSGTGSSTLVFDYTVEEDDISSDLDYNATDALSLSDGTILDLYNGLPIFTLPAPGESGSLSNTSDIVINPPRRVSSGSSASSQYTNLIAMGNIKQANELLNQFPNQINPVNPVVTPNLPTSTQITIKVPIITRTIKQKSTGDDIKQLQIYLNNHGYVVSATGPGSIGYETSYFGPKTKQAVIQFQLANGLGGDGIVGPLTREKLIKN